ncbi:HET-domain-containing protein, partial [Cadophora sp. DSE1049]
MSQSENHLPRPLSRHQWSQWQDRVFYTSALRPEKNEIRLMTILPGQANEDIRIKLNVVSLDDKPYFEALSYVWGDPKVTEDIKLNGWIFPITTNLRAALQALRRTHEARVFWVDAICVNQRNVIERGSQVSLMVRIYSECMLCTVWLGEGTETIGRA